MKVLHKQKENLMSDALRVINSLNTFNLFASLSDSPTYQKFLLDSGMDDLNEDMFNYLKVTTTACFEEIADLHQYSKFREVVFLKSHNGSFYLFSTEQGFLKHIRIFN